MGRFVVPVVRQPSAVGGPADGRFHQVSDSIWVACLY